MLQLRDYQRESIDALYKYWGEGGGNGLIVLPTGAGKALVIATLIQELTTDYPGMRIANVTHSAPLVEQNFKEFIGLAPFADAGIYSASLNKRDLDNQVIFCGIQSIWNKTKQLGPMDLVLVDEAHAISRNADTQYGKFFDGIKEENPDSRVAGTTATDYRMDSGRLTEGDDRLFDDVVYEAYLPDLIEQGYLTRLTSQKTAAKIDLKGVGTRGGEYIPGQLAEAAEQIIDAAIAEDMIAAADRKAGLFFCASKENARHAAEAVRRHGKSCAVLTSDNAHETDKIFKAFRAGEIWGIASVNMITTGTNFPWVDFISLLLSTKSPGKLVQILGRGTRNFPGKTDCLIADHGRNLAYHGPIDQIRPREPGKGLGEQPKKQCPQDKTDEAGNCGCGEMIPISIMTCQCCGYIFPPNDEEKITAKADDTPVLSTDEPWHSVSARSFANHPGKDGKPDTVKVTYLVGMKSVKEWLCAGHGEVSKFAKSKADKWWAMHGGKRPFPSSVIEWLERQDELKDTTEVQLSYKRNPKHPDPVAHRVGVIEAANDNDEPPANDNRPAWMDELDDGIPF